MYIFFVHFLKTFSPYKKNCINTNITIDNVIELIIMRLSNCTRMQLIFIKKRNTTYIHFVFILNSLLLYVKDGIILQREKVYFNLKGDLPNYPKNISTLGIHFSPAFIFLSHSENFKTKLFKRMKDGVRIYF